MRRRDLCRECGPAVQSLLHYQIRRHGYGTLDLPFDHASSRWPAVGRGKRTPRCHVSVYPAGECGAAAVQRSATVWGANAEPGVADLLIMHARIVDRGCQVE